MIRIGTTANHIEPVAVEDDWRQRAVCREVEPELFFTTSGPGIDIAKTICGGCPARQECLDWALAVPEEHGVFGGLDERERRAIRRKQQPPKPMPAGGRKLAECGTPAAVARHRRLKERMDPACAAVRYTKPLAGADLPPAEAAA